jgi:methionine-rich copper-binding protein CopC
MRTLHTAIAWLLLTGSSCALAHAHLTHSAPADGAHLASTPSALELQFSEAAQLTALWIQKTGSDPQKLGPLPAKAADRIRIALPQLAPGEYLVTWRVLGSDGHVAPGQLHFSIAG